MTTIVAVQKKGQIFIGCDSVSTFGYRKETCPKIVPKQQKLFLVHDTYFGTAGSCCWDLVIKSYFKKYREKIDFSNLANTFESLCIMHKILVSEYYLYPCSENNTFESSEFNFLCANSFGIFEIEWDRSVRHFSTFAAIGSGEKYALGALSAVYDTVSDVKEIVHLGLETAAKYDKTTYGPFAILKVEQE